MKTARKELRVPIIALAGKANSGKNAAGDILAHHYTVKQVAFADTMKHFAHLCCRIPTTTLWGPSERKDRKTRRLLQRLGTEVMRDYDPDVWVDTLVRRLQRWENYGYDSDKNPFVSDPPPPETDFVVITDLRFLSELVGIRKYAHAYVIKIVRWNQPNPEMSTEEHTHQSETELDEIPENAFDCVIPNTKTLQDLDILLKEKIENFKQELEILRA